MSWHPAELRETRVGDKADHYNDLHIALFSCVITPLFLRICRAPDA
jgi:hypothetical protein